jgi:UDP-glucuronate 4-epimerase
MAIFTFVKNLINKKKINIFNQGNHYRDFTFIDDVTDATLEVLVSKKKFFQKNYNVFNIGNNKPIKLLKLINILEILTKKKFKKSFLDIQKGDVYKTYADINKIQSVVNYRPKTNIKDGLRKFIEWYKSYYK